MGADKKSGFCGFGSIHIKIKQKQHKRLPVRQILTGSTNVALFESPRAEHPECLEVNKVVAAVLGENRSHLMMSYLDSSTYINFLPTDGPRISTEDHLSPTVWTALPLVFPSPHCY